MTLLRISRRGNGAATVSQPATLKLVGEFQWTHQLRYDDDRSFIKQPELRLLRLISFH
jgi:hypothetical protein